MTQRRGWRLIIAVLIKAVCLFALLNLLFAVVYPRNLLGRISGYNWLFHGRERLPHGDVPERAFNITTSNLEAMFHSHIISDANPGEFRVAIIGDSSVWGFLLESDKTLAAKLNQLDFTHEDGRKIRFYNLGYPTLSVTKDLFLLDRAMEYEPDLILWFVTLESLPRKTQLDSPLLQLNPLESQKLIQKYALNIDDKAAVLAPPTLFERTIVGSRVELSELVRLQLYGFPWSATGVDHYIPETFNERREDLSADIEFKGFLPGEMRAKDLHFEALRAGVELAGDVPVLFINEPIFISQGENSDVRYNFFYPRWAYDQYRSDLNEQVKINGWRMVDLWDALPGEVFTDSSIHYSEIGTQIMAMRLADIIPMEIPGLSFAR